MIFKCQTILYVDDQYRSSAFYEMVLNQKPRLNVPGMTEFEIATDAILGLMPKTNILNLLKSGLPHVKEPTGLLQAELYLLVDDPVVYHQRALKAGAQNVSDLTFRDWGHMATYCLDLDGYILAFATEQANTSV